MVGTKRERLSVMGLAPDEKHLARMAGTLCRGSTAVRAAAMAPREICRPAIGAKYRSDTRRIKVDMMEYECYVVRKGLIPEEG